MFISYIIWLEELGRKPEIIDWVESWICNSNKCFALFRP